MVVSAAWRRPTGGGRCRLLAAVLLGAVVVMAAHGGPLGAAAQEEELGGTDAVVQFDARHVAVDKEHDKKSPEQSPSPRRRSPSPSPEPERKPCFKVFAWRKTLLYVQSEDRFTYNEAQKFCSDKGVFMVGYDDPVKRLPLADLCYKNGNGCWVGGQVGDTCPYIDPKGNGASYPEKCERRHYAVCWGDLDKQRNNPAIWDNNCPKNNKSQDSKKRDKNYD
ncbi:hypothetical protein CHLRE_07g350200v5 [Chlamydomonas reinhardtii]|uniref:C-type lectin domain-containing protein n=1 Tax=Chlamydomonas reinhardtii TaxID=3055 RepID=A0A2K3DLA2_CHLRE|nr:uncharacterized protein CHLRE_07g350200v5 [Chlamydomonas reinhardtii]PNW81298.1 hypothetical protein CHLRE_07g350200v5 [Chlamydomonas reinhardtii]